MFKKWFSRKEETLKVIETENVTVKSNQEKFTEMFSHFVERTPYFIEKEIKQNTESGTFAYFHQEYPFGSLTLSVSDIAEFKCEYVDSACENIIGELRVRVEKDLTHKIICKTGVNVVNGSYGTFTQETVENLEEYSLLLRIAYTLADQLCQKQIKVFTEQSDDVMVLYFKNKKKEFEQQLLGV